MTADSLSVWRELDALAAILGRHGRLDDSYGVGLAIITLLGRWPHAPSTIPGIVDRLGLDKRARTRLSRTVRWLHNHGLVSRTFAIGGYRRTYVYVLTDWGRMVASDSTNGGPARALRRFVELWTMDVEALALVAALRLGTPGELDYARAELGAAGYVETQGKWLPRKAVNS